jgi:Flp pilus assembly protein TadB
MLSTPNGETLCQPDIAYSNFFKNLQKKRDKSKKQQKANQQNKKKNKNTIKGENKAKQGGKKGFCFLDLLFFASKKTKTNKCKKHSNGQVHFFPMFFPFLTFLLSPLILLPFFSVLKFCFRFSMCSPFFAFFQV